MENREVARILRETALLLPLLLTPPLPAQDLKALEQQLKTEYEGKVVKVRQSSDKADNWLDLPKADSHALDPGSQAFLWVDNVTVKKKEIELRARRVYYFQDTTREVRAATTRERKYLIRWRGTGAPSETSLRNLLEPLKEEPEVWVGYWPPPRPKQPGADPKMPSRELAPGVFTVGSDVTKPTCQYCPEPEYSNEARGQRLQGNVVLWCLLNEWGRVEGIRLEKSLESGLDESAVMAVANWRFRPALRDGKPIKTVFMLEVGFHLY